MSRALVVAELDLESRSEKPSGRSACPPSSVSCSPCYPSKSSSSPRTTPRGPSAPPAPRDLPDRSPPEY
eukprot:3414559-Pyramimonas_sp.AAC.1